jgi:Ner family transcriptional regulator
MRGSSMARLADDNGVSRPALYFALKRPSLRCERIIASFLGVPPHKIWPDRYDAHGNPIRKGGRRG